MSDFYKNMVKSMEKEGASLLTEGKTSAEFSGWIDTGSYALNAQVSGSMYGGIADNKVTGLAGEEATGKCARGSQKITVYMSSQFKPVEMTYKELYDMFGMGGHEVPYNVTEEIFVKDWNENMIPINMVVEKENHNIIRVDFEDGSSFECSEDHLFSVNGNSMKAKDVTEVDTINGSLAVVEVTPIGVENVYDISVPSPHWYVANDNGVIHHNTYFALALLQNFQNKYENAGGFHYDTESATTKEMMESRGIDPNRVIVSEPESIEDFRTHAAKTLNNYMAIKGDKPRMMMLLDSLGQLPSAKEVEDIDSGKNVRDMTRTQIIKGAFRRLTLMLAKAKVPMIVTNHTYQTMELYSKQVVSGGSGLRYAASTILMLSRNVDKDLGRGEGNLINCFLAKSRFTKPETSVKLRLSYTKGLDRYYGLLDIAEEYGIFEKSGTQYIIDGKKYFGKTINENPEKFYTPEVMEKLEEACAAKFKFGEHELQGKLTEDAEDEE